MRRIQVPGSDARRGSAQGRSAKHSSTLQKFFGGCVFLIGYTYGNVLFPMCGLEGEDGIHAVVKYYGMESFVFQISFYDVGLKKRMAFSYCFHRILY